MEEFQSIFIHSDGNGEGKINSTELADILKEFNESLQRDLESLNSDYSPKAFFTLPSVWFDRDRFIGCKELSYSNSYNSIRKGVSMENMERIFNKFDSDGDGKISSREVASLLETIGSDLSQEELKRMMSEIDTDGDGFIDLKEFAHFHLATDKDTDGYNDLKDAFDVYDKDTDGYNDLKAAFDVFNNDKDGLISAAELRLVFKNLGEKCTVRDCRKMIRSVDVDGGGGVNFEEFKNMTGNKSFSRVQMLILVTCFFPLSVING